MPRKKVLTDQQRLDARRANKAKTKNITVDADIVEILNERSDALAEVLGFRPTISQTLRYMLKNSK